MFLAQLTIINWYEKKQIKPNTSNNSGDTGRYGTITYNENLKDELALVSIRYKKPKENSSIEINSSIQIKENVINKIDFDFAQSIAGFGMILRDSKFKGNLNFNQIIKMAEASKGEDKEGYRKEFVDIVKKAKVLKK